MMSLVVCAYFWYYVQTYTKWHTIIDSANLIFHEAGHSIFPSSVFGMFVNVLAGSAFQVALPLLISIYFFCKNQKISGALCLLWVGQNLLNVSIYAADAAKMQLELLGGDSVIHDWNYILSSLGQLQNASFIASIIYNSGLTFISVGSALAIYYSWKKEVLT